MNKPTIIFTKGLPGSGKSTWAKEYIKQYPGFHIVCLDDIRTMLHNDKFTQAREKITKSVRMAVVKDLVDVQHKNVIIADTNLTNNAFDECYKYFGDKVTYVWQSFTDVPLLDCIKRNRTREKSIPDQAIVDMFERHLQPKITHDITLPNAVICDIDGTLARIVNRNPYDWDKVYNDEVIEGTKNILEAVSEIGSFVILVSGRDGSCATETRRWLIDNDIKYSHLYMRQAGDNRKDTVIKKELYEKHIKGKYNITNVFDDRLSVCCMWIEQGLPLYRVGNPFSDF